MILYVVAFCLFQGCVSYCTFVDFMFVFGVWELLEYGNVNTWRFGVVEVWSCGVLEFTIGRVVELWSCGVLELWA